jgi:hypothetical protein
MPRPSAAESLYPHLARRTDEPPKRPRVQPSLADALYPALAEKTESEWRERNRRTILPDIARERKR